MTSAEIIETINANFATVAEFNSFLSGGAKTIQLRELENELAALHK